MTETSTRVFFVQNVDLFNKIVDFLNKIVDLFNKIVNLFSKIVELLFERGSSAPTEPSLAIGYRSVYVQCYVCEL